MCSEDDIDPILDELKVHKVIHKLRLRKELMKIRGAGSPTRSHDGNLSFTSADSVLSASGASVSLGLNAQGAPALALASAGRPADPPTSPAERLPNPEAHAWLEAYHGKEGVGEVKVSFDAADLTIKVGENEETALLSAVKERRIDVVSARACRGLAHPRATSAAPRSPDQPSPDRRRRRRRRFHFHHRQRCRGSTTTAGRAQSRSPTSSAARP